MLALGMVSFFTDIHSETILALLPQFMANVLGLRKETIGLIEGLADATASVLKILSGWFSDRLGKRKPVVLAGYVISTALKPLLCLATTALHVLGVRLGDRVGKGIRSSARDALVAESVSPEQRGKAFGFHRAMDTAGAVVGTSLAILLLRAFAGDYRRVFLVATVAGVVAIVTILVGVRDIPREVREANNRKPRRELAGSFSLFLVAHTLFSAGNFTYAFFLLRAQDVGVPPALVPALYLWHNVVYALAAFPAGALQDRLGARKAQATAYLLQVVVCLGMATLASPYLMILWFAVYGLQLGATGACSRTTAASLMRPDRRGTDMGLLNACEGVGLLIASAVGGVLWDWHGQGADPFYWGAAMAFLGALVVLVALKGDKPGTQEAPAA